MFYCICEADASHHCVFIAVLNVVVSPVVSPWMYWSAALYLVFHHLHVVVMRILMEIKWSSSLSPPYTMCTLGQQTKKIRESIFALDSLGSSCVWHNFLWVVFCLGKEGSSNQFRVTTQSQVPTFSTRTKINTNAPVCLCGCVCVCVCVCLGGGCYCHFLCYPSVFFYRGLTLFLHAGAFSL